MKYIGQALAITVIVAVSIVLGTVPASAAEGLYLGLQLPYDNIHGDFTDSGFVGVDPGFGFGFIFGYGFTPNFSLEMNLSSSSHSVPNGWAFVGVPTTIEFSEFSINGKYAFLAPQSVQPYLLFGLGSYSLGDGNLRFSGSGYNLGAGVDFYTASNWSFGVGLIAKKITYDHLDNGFTPLSQNLNGDTTTLRFDATYHFF